MLEIIPPAEVLKPYRAMEDIYLGIWPIIDSANWRETWCEGELEKYPYWFSFEVVSKEGQLHYYWRVPKDAQRLTEAIFQMHYPGAEIFAVPDYTEELPANLPNKEYDVYGEDYVFFKDDVYPLKTMKFFEIKPEEIDKEKKLDPVHQLLEAMAKLKEGEQFWLQFVLVPFEQEQPFAERAKKTANKIAQRVIPEVKEKTMAGEAFRAFVYNKVPFEEVKEEVRELGVPLEMKLTPGEREVLAAVEEKASKPLYKTNIRGVYVYKRDARYGPHGRIARAYFVHFTTNNLNGIRCYSKTRTKIHYLFRKRRLFNRKRQIYNRYLKRFPPNFPKLDGPGTLVLNIEEVATIIHFPINASDLPSSVPRIWAKKSTPPPNLPIE